MKSIKKDYDMGFIYINNVIDSLICYENNRLLYPTLKDFYHNIIENIIKQNNSL